MRKWKEIKLEGVCLKITDGAHHSPKDFEDGLPMFSVKDMETQGFNYSRVKRILQEDFNRLIKAGCQPEIDDILIAKDGSYKSY
jgi:type I restriction enzyme S subunit